MKLLLDTHAALWFLSGDDRLGDNAQRQLIDDANRVLLSAVVVWEVAVKRALGKLTVPDEVARCSTRRPARCRSRSTPPPSEPVIRASTIVDVPTACSSPASASAAAARLPRVGPASSIRAAALICAA